jgi:hypothetical protein
MATRKGVLADKIVTMGPLHCPKCGEPASRKEEYRLSSWYVHPVESTIPGVPQMTACTVEKENS